MSTIASNRIQIQDAARKGAKNHYTAFITYELAALRGLFKTGKLLYKLLPGEKPAIYLPQQFVKHVCESIK